MSPSQYGAGDCARPEVAFDTDVFSFSWEDLLVLRFRPANELPRYVFELRKQTRAVSLWPFNRRLQDQGGNRVQVVGDCRVAQPMNFDWNTAATRGRIQNRQRFEGTPGNALDPITITVGWRVRERAFVAVGIGTEILLASLGRVKPAPCRHRIPRESRARAGTSLDQRPLVVTDASTAARDATSGRRAHQTCRRFGAGNGVIGVRSRVLSMPIWAIGSQRSISRMSGISRFRPRRERPAEQWPLCC